MNTQTIKFTDLGLAAEFIATLSALGTRFVAEEIKGELIIKIIR